MKEVNTNVFVSYHANHFPEFIIHLLLRELYGPSVILMKQIAIGNSFKAVHFLTNPKQSRLIQ